MNAFKPPETRYALSGDVSVAYQVMGDGAVDIIVVPGLFSHVEFLHEVPGYTAFLRKLGSFARVITFLAVALTSLHDLISRHDTRPIQTTESRPPPGLA